jgi:hypothetical protein
MDVTILQEDSLSFLCNEAVGWFTNSFVDAVEIAEEYVFFCDEAVG